MRPGDDEPTPVDAGHEEPDQHGHGLGDHGEREGAVLAGGYADEEISVADGAEPDVDLRQQADAGPAG